MFRLYLHLFSCFLISGLIFFTYPLFPKDLINDASTGQNRCQLNLKQVQNEVFTLANGTKQIVTYSLSDFKDQEECWRQMEKIAKNTTNSSEIAGVYFFTLPAAEITKIKDLTQNFGQYGVNLIGVYWKDPDSGTALKRFPNNVIDGQ